MAEHENDTGQIEGSIMKYCAKLTVSSAPVYSYERLISFSVTSKTLGVSQGSTIVINAS